jgi:hypothetical protein
MVFELHAELLVGLGRPRRGLHRVAPLLRLARLEDVEVLRDPVAVVLVDPRDGLLRLVLDDLARALEATETRALLWGSVASPRRTPAHQLYPKFTNILGVYIFERQCDQTRRSCCSSTTSAYFSPMMAMTALKRTIVMSSVNITKNLDVYPNN